jgi:hypothetical protein
MKMLSPVRAAKAATSVPTEVVASSLEKLREFIETHHMKAKMGPQSFADFERDLHARVMEVERDLVEEEMSRHDIDADAVVIDGNSIAGCFGSRRRRGRGTNALQGPDRGGRPVREPDGADAGDRRRLLDAARCRAGALGRHADDGAPRRRGKEALKKAA